MKSRWMFVGLALVACVAAGEPADPIDECATCEGGKADDLGGSCAAAIVVAVANTATFEELDVDAGLNARAAENIVDARAAAPFVTIGDVDAVPFVGATSMAALLAYGEAEGIDCQSSCGGDPVVAVANGASLAELDDDMGLDSRAAEGIVDGRPFASVAEVDAVPFVGPSALESMRAFGEAAGTACGEGPGIISDLDKTLVPPSDPDLALPPYPGAAALYAELLDGAGRITYVTARSPDRVVEVPAWLADHELPPGPIETGVSGIPFIARREKVADITRAFAAAPNRRHVLFGDTSHVDPETYAEVLDKFPDQVHLALVHVVTDGEPPDRLAGLHPYANYAETAAILAGAGLLSEPEARAVFAAARAEGLDLTDAELDALLQAHGR